MGEHSAVVWNWLYDNPSSATRWSAGDGTGPPNVDIEPKPTSSSMMSSTFGAFVGAVRCANDAGVESESSRWMSPAKGCDE